MLSPGNVVERYEVERELGDGGMARVYKVRHVALGSVHALKVLDPELVGNAELRARFLDEGRIQARLKHPNILGITDVVAAPGVAGLVMDYLEGESLDRYLARIQQPPTADEVRDIFLQVLEGMGFAHEQGVIHRDLKPSNIFLEQVRGRRVVRILDFGIAKAASDERRPTTRTGARMGTPQYMSPEQIRGAETVTVRSDIFSLGVTLYELATAQPCFLGESDFNIMEKIVRAEYVPPHVAYPGLERQLAATILRAMDLDPERRFASCREFAAALVSEPPIERTEEPVPEAPPAPRVATPAPVPESQAATLFQIAKSQRIPKPRDASGPVEESPRAPVAPIQQPEPEPARTPAARIPVVREEPPVVVVQAPEPEPARTSAARIPVVPQEPPAVAVQAPEPEPEPEPMPRPVRPPDARIPVARQVPPAVAVQAPAPEPRRESSARVVAVREAPVLAVKERTPAPIVQKERTVPPAPARERPGQAKPAPPVDTQPPQGRRAWRWVLLFALGGLATMFGSGLIGMLRGKGEPPNPPAQRRTVGGAPVRQPRGAPATPPRSTGRDGRASP
ncbi:protein kinase [Archangium violaceum]|uniref:serine/threonine-protein kinase n=1 Tax=Archangium violaceum TaxID=83451 RepID=UPI0019527ED2|nr:serine/threonine-protein kinase [Archangium violaceum]QRO00340.1 protein kinase [Archangium violaceum]